MTTSTAGNRPALIRGKRGAWADDALVPSVLSTLSAVLQAAATQPG
jgi:hypothetical protein